MLEFLYQALASEKGIKIWSTDVEALRQRLYIVRREACDTRFEVLAFVPSPTDPEILWILRRPDGNPKE